MFKTNKYAEYWVGEAAETVAEDQARTARNMARVEAIKLKRTFWDFYHDQRGGSCNG